jgi:glutathione S-transferase
MKLYGRYLSPFVRRVATTMNVMGQPFEQVQVAPFDEWEKALNVNPVVRIPALELDDGDVLIDSTTILDSLDEQAGANALVPGSGKERRDVLKLVAIAVGAMEKSVNSAYELRFHPAEKVSEDWVERCDKQTVSALQALDAHAEKAGADGWLYGDAISQADISATVAFTFATLARPKLGVAEKAPNLAKLAARLEATDAFKQTHPSA